MTASMDTFAEFVRQHMREAGWGPDSLGDWLDWPPAKQRKLFAGTLRAVDVSLVEACELAQVLGVSVDDLAASIGRAR